MQSPQTEALEVLREDSGSTLYRGAAGDDGTAMLALVAADTAHGPILQRLEREYAQRELLDERWAARPLRLERKRNAATLWLADPGGKLLSDEIGQPWETSAFLRIAPGIVSALGDLHLAGLIHRDLKPGNILVDLESGSAWLTGFAFASRYARERQSPGPPEVIEGTLAYMAPEQTGRMNRSMDSRSDLYALGVLFYEMLSGTLPFIAVDPLEWIHCHVARQATPLSDRQPAVPATLAAIVMKLLEKMGEDRYQTATGLRADLLRCRQEWEHGARITDFRLGAEDVSGRLMVPEKVYGRSNEATMLLDAFDRVAATGELELTLISGDPGIGKSSVVHEARRNIIEAHGIFISGKFHQPLRDAPCSPLADALSGLIRQILDGDPVELARWRQQIDEAVGSHCGLLFELLPELPALVGPQPALPALDPAEATQRFHSAFQRFVGALASEGHPLVVFLDDLQWLDPTTLSLVETIAVDPRTHHLHLIGAYRPSEVESDDPLDKMISTIRAHGRPIQELELGPLSIGEINLFVGDALQLNPHRTRALARLVHEKTGGNPFFAGQFLASLEEERLLQFETSSMQWNWDIRRIATKSHTDNLLALMVRRLLRLPRETQEALQVLSCLGRQADFASLRALSPPEAAMHARFEAALKAGVIIAADGRYQFLHDRVQERAYALIPEDARGAMHLRIGLTLSKAMPSDVVAEQIFDIASQLNRGLASSSDMEERSWIARLDLQAARKAKASTAYEAGCHYLAQGMAALDTGGWQHAHELSLSLHMEQAECEISRGRLDEAEALVDEMLRESRSKVDRAGAIVQKMTLQMMRGQLDQVARTGIEGLRMFDQAITAHPSAADVQADLESLYRSLGERGIEQLVDLPPMNDPDMAAAMSIMVRLGLASYFVDANLHQSVAIRLVGSSLAHGVSESSIYGCSGLGSCLGPVFGRHADGERFARAAVAIAEKGGHLAFTAGSYVALEEAMVWTRPIGEAVALLDTSIELAKEAGATLFACYAIEHRLNDLLFSGDSLDAMWRGSVGGLAFAEKSKVRHVTDSIASMQGFIQSLRGAAGQAAMDDEDIDARIRGSDIAAVACFHGILQMQRLFLLGDPAGAMALGDRISPIMWSARCNLQSVNFRVFQSLAIAAEYPQADAGRQAEMLATLEAHAGALGGLAAICPSSFLHKQALVAAELARVQDRCIDALRLYEHAVRAAGASGFIQDRALACELAAAFCLSLGLESAARDHLHEARQGYLLWAAHRKVALLDAKYPGLQEPAAPARLSTIEAPLEHVDLAAIVEVSQTLSGEIEHVRLIEKLMTISLEHAAAEKALLILHKADGLLLEAVACSKRDGISVERLSRPLAVTDLPDTILQHVLRSRRSVTLDDARQTNDFSRDAYLRQQKPRSILCLPLVRQGLLIGVLYFENNLATHVFTPERHAMLDLLSAQAAISLQNADLVAKLEQEIAERKQSEQRYALAIDAAADGHADWIAESDVFYCSPRLLEQWGLPANLTISRRQEILEVFPFHPEDRPWVVALINQYRDSSEKRLECEMRVIVRGEVRWMHLTTLYLRDPSGKLLRSSTATTDITDRRRAEDDLRLSEQRYALALAGSNEGVFDWDLVTGDTYLPARTQELLGLPIGRPWRSRKEWETLLKYYPGDLERMQAALEAHFAGQAIYDHEVRFIMPSGEVRCFRARGTVLRDADGTPSRMIGSLDDITERKRQQEDMLRLESRLRHAERFEAMGTLAGGIAHDFNNILGAILGFGERALNSVDEGSRLHNDLANVIVAGERGRTLVDRILSFSRGTGERVPVHVEKVVREALDLLQAKLPPWITLQADLRAGRAAVHGDATQIHQLLMNIGTNAVHAMPEAGTLSVALDVVEVADPRPVTIGTAGPGAWLVLNVADEGTGIPEAIIDRIFDPFFTTKEASVGTGLGLSLVLRIATEMGGAIDVRSAPGAGTSFLVYLPRSGDAPETPDDDAGSAPAGQGQRILVVDDEEPLLGLTIDALRGWGYQPIGFTSASAALEAFLADPSTVDALVTDQRMPGMSGDGLIREIRRVRPLIPIVLVSGYVSEIAGPREEVGWADEVLVKPLRKNALATSLARLLGGR